MAAIFTAVLILVVFAAALAAASVRVLREYERAVVFRLGRLVGERGPGLVLLIPGIDRMVRVTLRTRTVTIPPQDVIPLGARQGRPRHAAVRARAAQ